ncbi:MAG: hypothetical protein JFR38_11235 [Muribaculaceae bacterium]|nr:hypothetical protein [Muribaculaceae bacterium]
MRITHFIAVATLIMAVAATSCKTSEANYRAAYDKAVAGRNDATPIDSTIYGKVRRDMQTTVLVAGNDTAELRVMHVNPTPADNGSATSLPEPYGVVAGQFKTLFNARSLCARLVDAGYSDASIVNTAEPYYYVVASWHPGGKEAIAALRSLEKEAPVAMREPLPFVLRIAGYKK